MQSLHAGGRAGGVVRQHSRLVEKQEDMQNHGETELCSETRIQLLSLVERCDTCKNKDAETFREREGGRGRGRQGERQRGLAVGSTSSATLGTDCRHTQVIMMHFN